MEEIMRSLVNTIGSEQMRLALLAKLTRSRGLTERERSSISNARVNAPEPYRAIIRAVSDYCDLQDESRIA